MPADTVTIAGHVAERGSEAEVHLRNAARAEKAAAWAYCYTPASYDRYEIAAERDIENARRAPGYLGPATDTETPDAP